MRNAFIIAGSIIISALIISYSLPNNRFQYFAPAQLQGATIIFDTKNKSSCVVLPFKTKTYSFDDFKICKK